MLYRKHFSFIAFLQEIFYKCNRLSFCKLKIILPLFEGIIVSNQHFCIAKMHIQINNIGK